ncbi:Bifunctional bis(5'-adenosyl)-triphosphatase/adenylylsulfatase FHIT [Bienertia sinuspersici]
MHQRLALLRPQPKPDTPTALVVRPRSSPIRPVSPLSSGGPTSRLQQPLASTSVAQQALSKSMASESFKFGPYKIDPKEVFYSTTHSYAMVNLRPLLPVFCLLGLLDFFLHVLVSPRREVKRFGDLTADETCDLWLTAQKVGTQLELYHKASSLTLAIQVCIVTSQ